MTRRGSGVQIPHGTLRAPSSDSHQAAGLASVWIDLDVGGELIAERTVEGEHRGRPVVWVEPNDTDADGCVPDGTIGTVTTSGQESS